MPSQSTCQMDPMLADAIYSVLEDECGAEPWKRDEFIAYAATNGITEFRFCGTLGFGGKVWDAGPNSCYRPRLWVSCYREDETPARLKAIDAANLRLKALA